jgi:flagellum-specific peptidoglycan hydrolase FlgJ
VNPKGKAPNWNDMGNGNWASAPDYAAKVLTVYNEMRADAGLPGV